MNVLSLFNGMGFGRMALDTLGIPVTKYYSSEIDKYANQAAQDLFPDTIQIGDVTKWREWDIDLGNIDLLIAGFPCQAWSMAGKMQGDNDPRGALVHDLIDIWSEIRKHNPNMKFMFENVKMKKEFLVYINDLFGVIPICINSALVSAQSRRRYYWTNIGVVKQPEEIETSICDYIDFNIDMKSISPGKINRVMNSKFGVGRYITRDTDKCGTIIALYAKQPSDAWYVLRDNGNITMLTPIECARLQTVPEHHIDTLLNAGISNTQLYKMLGNGFTHNVIVHILSSLK